MLIPPIICVASRPTMTMLYVITINASACIKSSLNIDLKFLVNNIYPMIKLSRYDLL